MNIFEIKQTLINYYKSCLRKKHHKLRHVADEYEIPRRKAYKAFELGKKLFNNSKILKSNKEG